MDNKTTELLTKQVLTSEELSKVQNSKDIKNITSCGKSEGFLNHMWYNVKTNDNKEYNVYTKAK